MTSAPIRPALLSRRKILLLICSRYSILLLLFVLMLFAWFDRTNVERGADE